MPTVDVRFTPLPAHVRTARLIALAVARRAGVADDLLDEIRLAVGEACSRAVGVHAEHAPHTPVTMRLSDDADRFVVDVIDVGKPDVDPAAPGFDALAAAGSDPEPTEPAFGLVLIGGLVEEVEISTDSDGTKVSMAWPATSIETAGAAPRSDPE